MRKKAHEKEQGVKETRKEKGEMPMHKGTQRKRRQTREKRNKETEIERY